MRPGRIVEEFPAPTFRGYQQQALENIATAFDDGAKVVLVRAPTGSGKSLLARAICGAADRADEGGPHRPVGAYYTTPQVSQLDAVASDPLLDDIAIIRGKRNYACILPQERDTRVDRAPCARIPGYDCQVHHRCPYFSDRAIASARQIAGMTLAYFMQTAGSTVFGMRDVVVIDEAHGLSEWAEMYATIELSAHTVPDWEALTLPADLDDPQRLLRFSEHLVERFQSRLEPFQHRDELTASEVATRDRLRERIAELEWFCQDYRNPSSPTTWVVDQSGGGEHGISIKPLDPARFLHRTVWDRGNRFALLSATILDKRSFCRSVGLSPNQVQLIDVPHTFPVERRPLYDVTQGKMTLDHRQATIPKIARTILRIMATHPRERGIIHCHSYGIQQAIAAHLDDFGVSDRICAHDRTDRDAALAAWLDRSDPTVFLSVTMEEALDLSDDLARWQVLCKAPFPNVGDPAVAARLESGDWDWYYRRTARTVIQACGRVIRNEDDYGATYLADSSLLRVFERTNSILPPWFKEQVDRLDTPDLATFDPSAALSGITGGGVEPANQGRQTNSGRRHPLSDVWGTD